MINIVYRGQGGAYANYLRQAVKKIAAHRQAALCSDAASFSGYRVAVTRCGEPLTAAHMAQILRKNDVAFFVGDSRGLPAEVVQGCDLAVSVSSLPVGHQLEAAVLAEQLERAVLRAAYPDLASADDESLTLADDD